MSMMASARPYDREIRFILQVAMVLFVYTVVVGILNGIDLVDFNRGPLLAHVHVGTLGWLTMAVFAGSLALFGPGDEDNQVIRNTALAAPIVAVLYNIAFFTTTGLARPIIGTLMFLVITVFLVWALGRSRRIVLSVPHLGLLAGLATSFTGAIFGILLGILVAKPDSGITSTVQDAHPATMVVGFLVPVAMAFIEWILRPDSIHERATRIGWFQVGAPFFGGLILVVGLLTETDELAGIALPLELLGLVLFLWRMWPAIRRTSLLEGTARHGALATPFFIVNIALLVYLVSKYIDDFEAAPMRLGLALDHSVFVGVLTNAIVGWIVGLSAVRRPPLVDDLVFWGINLGVAGFLIGLVADSSPIIRVFTPVLGAAILLAIVVHARGMGDPRAAFARSEPVLVESDG